jgi:DNA repair protein RadD
MALFPSEPQEIKLRPYQEDVIQGLRDGIKAGLRRQVLVAPTGSGKTVMAMHLVKKAQEKASRTWFIADRVSLIDQTSAQFSKYGIEHGIIQAQNIHTDYSKPIQVASAQTIARRKFSDEPDLFIIDECHARFKSTMELIEKCPSAKVIGLTATPFTAGMADDWDGLVNSATTNQLLAQGDLAPLKIKACVAPDMEGVKKKFTGEWDEEQAGERGVKIVGDVVQTWVEQTRKHFGGPVKTIVFSPSVKHGAELCRQFADAGFNFQQISYLDKNDDERRAKIEEFRKPDSAIDGLVSCAVLTKGFDVVDIKVGISCRPYRKSFSSHIQEMGRVMRPAPGKDYGLWLCHSGNCVRFAQDTAYLFEYGVEALSDATKQDSVARELDEKVKREYFCGDCGMQMPPGKSTCGSCGWQRPTRSEIEIVKGNLVDIDFAISEAFKPRPRLRAACLSDPKGVWNAAICHTMQASTRGDEAAKKWAMGIWFGLYEGAKPPRGFFDSAPNYANVTADQFSLVEREIKRFRKHRRAA